MKEFAKLGNMIPYNLSQYLSDNLWILVVVLIWSMIWKGLALWHSARRRQKVWFVVLLILNTVGILEIIYLFAVAKIQRRKESATV